MASGTLRSFPLDGLETNRSGGLTDEQRKGFRSLSWSRRRSALSSSAFLVAGAMLIFFFAPPTAPPVTRATIVAIALAIAAFLVVRAVVGADALTRDLREPRVECVEGAIGKRFVGSGSSRGTYFLDVGDRRFRVSPGTYRAAPDHGFVRLYFLPRSKSIVNLERLPDPPMPGVRNAMNVIESLAPAMRSQNRRERNEAHAVLGGMADALDASFSHASAGAPKPSGDSRPLADAIVGTWRHPIMTVTFMSSGRVTAQMFQGTRNGRWSVDSAGRLHSDITGQPETTDAWVSGDQLTISVQGENMTLTRES